MPCVPAVLTALRRSMDVRQTIAKMADDTLDIELFIEEVKKYPLIWNTKDEEYHDKVKKRAAWTRICETFCENFHDKSEIEKNDIGNRYINKWRNLRDNFLRTLRKQSKSGQTRSFGRRYIYARQLSFLLQSEKIETSMEESSFDDSNDVKMVMTSTFHPVTNSSSQPAKRIKAFETPRMDFVNTVMPSSTTNEPDDDKSFFDSLIPAVKLFNLDQKLEFRSEVLNLVKSIRSYNIPPPLQN